MLPVRARAALVLMLLISLASCGDQSLFLSPSTGTSDLQIVSASDGQVFESGASVPLMVTAQDTASKRDVEIEVTLTSPSGQSLWHSRTAALLNEQSPVNLPANLPSGLYRLDYVLYSSGEVAQKKSVSFFVAPDSWKITGIRSFPPQITAGATVMLKAELEIPANANPWLRWSWKGKVIQKGLLSDGLGQILWDVPGQGDVYTVTLELFPSAPTSGSDYAFTSSLSLSTDIVVSGGPARDLGRLGPAASFLTLLRLQGSLIDVGTGARKNGSTRAAPIGTPSVVSLQSRFGYQLDGSSGIRIPWFALPANGGVLRPFTISVGVSFDDLASAHRIVSAETSDGSFSLVLSLDPRTASPSARVSGSGTEPIVIPWGGPPLAPRRRVLLSLSIAPSAGGVAAQWFLNGLQVSSMTSPVQIPVVSKPEGSVTIGGPQGFRGVVDEFGVYDQDPAGRPSTDPDLYARAQAGRYGEELVFATGFDGMSMPSSFTLEGRGTLAAGSLRLAPGAHLALPAIAVGDPVSVTIGIGAGSARRAELRAQWQGESQAPVVVPAAVTRTAGALGDEVAFRLSADGGSLTVTTPEGERQVRLPPPASGSAALVVGVGDPADAAADLVLDSVLAVRSR